MSIILQQSLQHSTQWCRSLGQSTIGLVFPNSCQLCACGLSSEDSESAIGFCLECQSRLINDDRNACLGCGCPIGPYLPVKDHCLKCQRADYRFAEVIRLGLYRDDLRDAVIHGKEGEYRSLCVALARMLVRTQRERLEAVEADVVVPVPSFWMKRLLVWHHQADLLAKTVAAELRMPLSLNLLRKVRHTTDQSDLPRAARKKNLLDAFRVRNSAAVAGKVVLLVDDVLTTRTTANECARALRKAGAKRVVVAAIAAVE